MKVTVTIEQDGDDESSTSMGISAAGVDPMQAFKMMLAGAEMIVHDVVHKSLMDNGAEQIEADYASPLRTRILALEILVTQPITPYSWVQMDLGPGLT